MTRLMIVCLLTGSSLALGACIAGVAASAVSMAARSGRSQPVGNEHLQPTAEKACSTQASQYGAVHVIDVQQVATSRIIVWGTVENGKGRQSFECAYGTTITGFKLRAIASQH